MLSRGLFCTILFTQALIIIPLHAATVSFSVDNDGLVGSDREYSSGLFLRWSSAPDTIGYSVEIASQLWTPSDIKNTQPQKNERPYSGLFYIKSRAYQQTDDQAYIGSLLLGSVGPSSGAEYSQSIIHTLLGSPEPMGWEYQIYDDFVYQIGLEAQRLITRSNWGEISVLGRGKAGNLQSEVALGATYRFGTDLANTFGSTSTQAGNNIDISLLSKGNNGSFFFITLETLYRFNDITLDGDKPTENSILTIENAQLAGSTGVALYYNKWGTSLSFNIQSKQFTTSAYNHHSFGNLSFFFRY